MDLKDLYQEIILDHGKNPRNLKKSDNFNKDAKGHNPLCGDKVHIYLKVDENNKISDIAFEGSGCAISMASASIMTDLMKEKKEVEVKELVDDFLEMIKQNPELKSKILGENGKKITKVKLIDDDLPIIIGQVNIKKFLDFKNKLINAGFDFNDINKFYSYRSNRWDISYKNKIIIKLPSDELDNSLRILKNIIEKSNLRDVKVIDLRIKKRIILS